MPADAWVPLLTAEVALLLVLSLGRRALRARAGRRPPLVSWTLSLAAFTAGAVALWYGSAFGWSASTFRLYYLCGALWAVPLLALGQLQLQLSRRAGQNAALVTAAFCVVAGYVVVLTPLRGGAHIAGRALPDGQQVLPALPRALVGVSNGVGTVVILVGVAVAVRRLRRPGVPGGARGRVAGLLLIAAGTAAAGAGGALTFLGRVTANATGLLVGVVLLYLGVVRAGRAAAGGRHRAA